MNEHFYELADFLVTFFLRQPAGTGRVELDLNKTIRIMNDLSLETRFFHLSLICMELLLSEFPVGELMYYGGLKFVPLGFKRLVILQSVKK